MKFGFRELLLLNILVAVPVSSYFLVFRPVNAEIDRANKEIEHKQSMLNKLREETARSADLAKANADIAESIKNIEARLPTNKELDSIVRQVSDLAVEAGLQPPTIKSAKPVKAALYMEQPLEMNIVGNFHRFYDFLLKLEQLPRITRIPDMTIKRAAVLTGPNNENADGDMEASFTLSIYFQDDTAVKGAN